MSTKRQIHDENAAVLLDPYYGGHIINGTKKYAEKSEIIQDELIKIINVRTKLDELGTKSKPLDYDEAPINAKEIAKFAESFVQYSCAINVALASGKNPLVICKNGRSRSPCVIAAFFILFRGLSYDFIRSWMNELYAKQRPATAEATRGSRSSAARTGGPEFPNFSKFDSVLKYIQDAVVGGDSPKSQRRRKHMSDILVYCSKPNRFGPSVLRGSYIWFCGKGELKIDPLSIPQTHTLTSLKLPPPTPDGNERETRKRRNERLRTTTLGQSGLTVSQQANSRNLGASFLAAISPSTSSDGDNFSSESVTQHDCKRQKIKVDASKTDGLIGENMEADGAREGLDGASFESPEILGVSGNSGVERGFESEQDLEVGRAIGVGVGSDLDNIVSRKIEILDKFRRNWTSNTLFETWGILVEVVQPLAHTWQTAAIVGAVTETLLHHVICFMEDRYSTTIHLKDVLCALDCMGFRVDPSIHDKTLGGHRCFGPYYDCTLLELEEVLNHFDDPLEDSGKLKDGMFGKMRETALESLEDRIIELQIFDPKDIEPSQGDLWSLWDDHGVWSLGAYCDYLCNPIQIDFDMPWKWSKTLYSEEEAMGRNSFRLSFYTFAKQIRRILNQKFRRDLLVSMSASKLIQHFIEWIIFEDYEHSGIRYRNHCNPHLERTLMLLDDDLTSASEDSDYSATESFADDDSLTEEEKLNDILESCNMCGEDLEACYETLASLDFKDISSEKKVKLQKLMEHLSWMVKEVRKERKRYLKAENDDLPMMADLEARFTHLETRVGESAGSVQSNSIFLTLSN